MTDSAPNSIIELIERFRDHADAYHAGRYNETQIRREFIDPLFKALGWDVDNSQGHAEAYKEVIHEDAIKIGGATKAPDYCFRLGGVRKFFVEAKKPSVDIQDDAGPAFQLRRYAWSAKLPLSILTDFEELAVYDCRVRPAKTDKSSKARTLFLRYDELPQRWAELANIFSKDAILKGSFDRYAESTKQKHGTAEVDAAFLAEIEEWRDMLARGIAQWNPGLSQRDLNFSVQRTIDRVVFLRICEDRGIEPYGELLALTNGVNVYPRLFERFRRADERYNSGLFHFEKEPSRPEAPDGLTPTLKIDDKPLKDILNRLYYPESPYEFSVLPADILGQVYEQFLGKVIRLTAGHQAKVEEKPEVRKAGGVYYTPTHIVEYIVRQTVGKLVEGRTPRQVGALTDAYQPSRAKNARPLTVLDPACGSGSFLLVAYQFLLDWYRDAYLQEGIEKHSKGKAPRLFRHGSGEWRLTTAERKRILLSHIHGVDIDAQAVETTKLSLLLKVLEGETGETIGSNLTLFHQRALPDLAGNIKCGNSLIGPDFYEGRLINLIDEEERLKVNVFDWNAEFREILSAGGFHAVIGNPPWGQKQINKDDKIIRYLREHFPSVTGIFDLFRPFVERGIRLARSEGCFGMVLPDIVLLKDYQDTRRFILDHLRIHEIDWWGMAFRDAVIDASTLVGSRSGCPADHLVRCTIHSSETETINEILQSQFQQNERYVFNLYLSEKRRSILQRLSRWPCLGDFFEVHEGVHSGNMRKALFVDDSLDSSCRPMLFGRDEIAPYRLHWKGKHVRLSVVPKRKTPKRYANAGQPDWYERDKILVRRTGDYVLAAVDRNRRYASNNFFLVFPHNGYEFDLDALCAILNSPFMTWFFRTIEPRKGRVFSELKIKHLSRFPLPLKPENHASLRRLAELTRQRCDCVEKLTKTRQEHSRVSLQRLIVHLDGKISDLVYELYQLPAKYKKLIMKEIENDGEKEHREK